MRIAPGLLVLLLLSACATTPELVPCEDPRPQVCTMQYNPTCAQRTDGTSANYSSPCNACADDNVVGYTAGSCPE
ncbi:MAG: hypothetical protein HKN19_02280 [Halioglobus sp.]|nr:hypothetical protein [Halioglobus sp.]